MAHVRYQDKEDMQDETYRILSELIRTAIENYYQKDSENLLFAIDSIYVTIGHRFKKEEKEEFQKRIDEVKDLMYIEEEKDDYQLTAIIDIERELLQKLCQELDKIGILLRIRISPDEIIAHGGGSR